MPTHIEWNDSYSVHNPELDAQHQRLLKIVNSVPDEFDDDQARQIVLMFISHAREHFVDEEQVMKDIGYPDLEKHKEIHDDLLLQLGHIAADNFPDQNSLTHLKKFISDWLNNHFLTDDMEYVHFINKEKGIKTPL